ncbi:hypothetical protein KP509_39G011200 [Ceratopteris richardii]|uniref:Inositol-pentakisphosphate 2-kinase n=2 Tax=Ceratopteris richardii TaxID=49495 RepID=A0A8T2PZ62_CERRI|nr:hypothetical protein KP509_39G011200 [Ceratopteris richardii]
MSCTCRHNENVQDSMDDKVENVHKVGPFDVEDWCYRGEGAANIVLAYKGSDPFLVGKVLRIRKKSVDKQLVDKSKVICQPGKPILSEDEQKLWQNWPSVAEARSFESLLQAYARDVMGPLLGPELVDPGIIVYMSTEFLEKIACIVEHERPLSRRAESEIDSHSNSALLISDHSVFCLVGGPQRNIKTSFLSIAVEIKPKCGFLPNSDLIVAENFIKKIVPRYTMHQTLKHYEGKVKRLSQYSPLDLFSEDLERINQAVHHLFSVPQNNLRLFVGGTVIDTSTSDLDHEGVKWQVLNAALQGCMLHDDGIQPVEVLKELVSQSLHKTDVLKNLLAAQKLDIVDIEGSIHAYRKLSSREAMDSSHGRELSEDECKNFEFPDGMSLLQCIELVRNYLIAATAKDCSLMLTFQQVLDNEPENMDVKYHKIIFSSKAKHPFLLKVNFLDLDLKPLTKMHHYYQIDQKIVKAYLATLQTDIDQEGYSESFVISQDGQQA